ncbi:hypothetical protein EDD37DRAFT_654611 [Exophiala viscosa]|uniref:Uncharacterized protein n=1 Tax=Exophiala viscosa TaxID=2486360 RepID=A0AAN6DNI2_9EURO|nr:hypothetical protein EDD36DRAFT_422600 [Exophiala viscosa]KAI1619723.1 hypothetical protein EDD37DRAFT_654611 [Exophiala viscosa]
MVFISGSHKRQALTDHTAEGRVLSSREIQNGGPLGLAKHTQHWGLPQSSTTSRVDYNKTTESLIASETMPSKPDTLYRPGFQSSISSTGLTNSSSASGAGSLALSNRLHPDHPLQGSHESANISRGSYGSLRDTTPGIAMQYDVRGEMRPQGCTLECRNEIRTLRRRLEDRQIAYDRLLNDYNHLQNQLETVQLVRATDRIPLEQHSYDMSMAESRRDRLHEDFDRLPSQPERLIQQHNHNRDDASQIAPVDHLRRNVDDGSQRVESDKLSQDQRVEETKPARSWETLPSQRFSYMLPKAPSQRDIGVQQSVPAISRTSPEVQVGNTDDRFEGDFPEQTSHTNGPDASSALRTSPDVMDRDSQSEQSEAVVRGSSDRRYHVAETAANVNKESRSTTRPDRSETGGRPDYAALLFASMGMELRTIDNSHPLRADRELPSALAAKPEQHPPGQLSATPAKAPTSHRASAEVSHRGRRGRRHRRGRGSGRGHLQNDPVVMQPRAHSPPLPAQPPVQVAPRRQLGGPMPPPPPPPDWDRAAQTSDNYGGRADSNKRKSSPSPVAPSPKQRRCNSYT